MERFPAADALSRGKPAPGARADLCARESPVTAAALDP
jgi:hypothetical protein